MRYRSRVDANHHAVVSALRQIGCSVTDLSRVGGGVPDLLVGYHGRTLLVEVKDRRTPTVQKDGYTRKARAGKLEETQVAWMADWRGLPVIVAYSPEEAVAAVLAAIDAL